MNTQTATTKPLTLEAAVEGYLNSLRANNRAELTLTTYQTDLSQFITWLKEHVGWSMQTVRALTMPKRGLLVPEGEEVDWDKLFPSGFRPLPRRWVVERSLAWITRWRRLARDHEGLPQSSEVFIKLSASSRMLTKLAPAFP